jgi:predicted metal-dependent phosphoesterase TrpH
MTADLHTHTNASDANITRGQLLGFAAGLGLERLAITDHDTMRNSYRRPDDAVEVIEGCELSALDPGRGRKVHILCYLPKDREPLEQLFEAMRRKRLRAGEEMLDRVHRIYPVVNEESVKKHRALNGVIFKQSIMNVLLEYGIAGDIWGPLYRELFDSRNGSCYVPVESPGAAEVLEMARMSRGVVALAHPSVYRSMLLARELAAGGLLDGLEVHHPRNTAADREALLGLCAEYGLLAVGGSDYHGANGSARALPGACLTEDSQLARLFELSAGRHAGRL